MWCPKTPGWSVFCPCEIDFQVSSPLRGSTDWCPSKQCKARRFVFFLSRFLSLYRPLRVRAVPGLRVRPTCPRSAMWVHRCLISCSGSSVLPGPCLDSAASSSPSAPQNGGICPVFVMLTTRVVRVSQIQTDSPIVQLADGLRSVLDSDTETIASFCRHKVFECCLDCTHC